MSDLLTPKLVQRAGHASLPLVSNCPIRVIKGIDLHKMFFSVLCKWKMKFKVQTRKFDAFAPAFKFQSAILRIDYDCTNVEQ